MLINSEMIQNLSIQLGQSATLPFQGSFLLHDGSNEPPRIKNGLDKSTNLFDDFDEHEDEGRKVEQQLISSLTKEADPMSHTVNGNVLSKFSNIVKYIIDELFPPRLILDLAKKIIKIPATLKAAIKVGIQDTLAEEGLKEDPRFITASNCLSSSMERLSKEFFEEHQAMSTAVEAAQRIEQCENFLGPFSAYMPEVCAQEIFYAGGAFKDHHTKMRDLAKKLESAAEDCDKQASLINTM